MRFYPVRSGGVPKGLPSTSPDAPINGLPPELLLNIFRESLKLRATGEYYDTLYGLMLVCSGWATLIKDTAKLWSIVDAGRPERIPLVLERSRSAPLTIQGHLMGRLAEYDDVLFNESHRWESIRIQQTRKDVQGDLQRRLDGVSNASVLKDFHAIGSRHASTAPVLNLFSGQAPKLESIRLTRWNVHYDSPSFNNLRTLKLTEIYHKMLTWASFFAMLQRCCQHLTVLHLNNVKFDELSAEHEADVLEFPNITNFRISDLEENTHRILKSINIPRCANVQILDFKAETAADLQFMPHLTAAFGSALKPAERITLAVDNDVFRVIAFAAGRRIFDFCGELPDDPLKALEIAATQWGLLPTTRAEIRLLESGDLEPLLTILRTLPNVTTIVLYQLQEEVVRSVLELLGDSYTSPDGATTWYCPNLENFLTEQCGTRDDTPGDFVNMLDRRYENGGGERPRRLK